MEVPPWDVELFCFEVERTRVVGWSGFAQDPKSLFTDHHRRTLRTRLEASLSPLSQ
jgi:hypothetical protein